MVEIFGSQSTRYRRLLSPCIVALRWYVVERSSRQETQCIELPFNVDNRNSFLVRWCDQRSNKDVEQLVVAATDGQRSRLGRAKMAVDQFIETRNGELFETRIGKWQCGCRVVVCCSGSCGKAGAERCQDLAMTRGQF